MLFEGDRGMHHLQNQTQLPAFVAVPAGPLVISGPPEPSCMELSLVLPTFREAHDIVSTLEATLAVLHGVDGLRFEIIVVDDDSPDNTARLALDASARLPGVRVMHRKEEKGLATAVIRGWQAASGSVLAAMDADLQHPPEVLRELVAAIRGGVDLAVASRHVEHGGVSDWSIFRRTVSRTAQIIGLIVLPGVVGKVRDPMSGYFMVRRDVIAGRLLNPAGYKILVEVLARGKLATVAEIGYVFRERKQGQSKVTWGTYAQYFQHLFRLRLWLARNSRLIRAMFGSSRGGGPR